jgi:hypothetical protein
MMPGDQDKDEVFSAWFPYVGVLRHFDMEHQSKSNICKIKFEV